MSGDGRRPRHREPLRGAEAGDPQGGQLHLAPQTAEQRFPPTISGHLVAVVPRRVDLERAPRGAGADAVPRPPLRRGHQRHEGGGAGHVHADARRVLQRSRCVGVGAVGGHWPTGRGSVILIIDRLSIAGKKRDGEEGDPDNKHNDAIPVFQFISSRLEDVLK